MIAIIIKVAGAHEYHYFLLTVFFTFCTVQKKKTYTTHLYYCILTVCKIPYSGKFSREKIFTNFANYRLFAKILSANVLFFVDKDRAIALIRENIIREMLYLAHSRKFSPAKIYHYTVCSATNKNQRL